MATTRRKGARKVSKNIPQGIAYIKASFNNTIVSVADRRGNVISWCSAGKLKYSGARKSTAFVATRIASEAAAVAMQNGMREVEVKVSGPGAGREAAFRDRRHDRHLHQRHHARSPQRLPSPQAPPRVICSFPAFGVSPEFRGVFP